MGNFEFENLALDEVLKVLNQKQHDNGNALFTRGELYVVWLVKVLGNNKCLISTSRKDDTTYIEVTYDGNRDQMYLDFYIKLENVVVRDVTGVQ